MERRKECVAMLLAGGQGSRLRVLTEHTAKPAVPFGGNYRIIDFSLSNCINSGIDTVGILTQYQPMELNEYIGNGQPWDLDRNFGGAHILPPYTKSRKNEWYKGTANAIYQNIPFIERYSPTYVLMLSGDHIYRMDYRQILREHAAKGAECTIAVVEVNLDDATRMGIMAYGPDGAITEFEEKPRRPKSNQASMGVYVFNWELLKEYLIADELDSSSANDFAKNVIPAMLRDKRRLFAYPFKGYWKDVGTLDSLWEANMDLLDPRDPIDLRNPHFRIYARNYAHPSSRIVAGAVIRNAFVTEGCVVRGHVENSILHTGCTVEPGAVVADSVVMPGSVIGRGAVVRYSIVGEGCVVEPGARIGERPEDHPGGGWGISVIGHGNVISAGRVIGCGEII